MLPMMITHRKRPMSTDFTNNPLDPDTLPSIGSLELNQLDPAYPKLVLVQTSAVLLIPLTILALFLVSLFGSDNSPLTLGSTLILITVALVLVIGILALTYIEAKARRYCLREHDFIYRSGLIFKRTVVQPLLRVQHIEVSQNPLEARWDLATLKLFSAGGYRFTFALPGLPKELADSLYQQVIDYQETRHE